MQLYSAFEQEQCLNDKKKKKRFTNSGSAKTYFELNVKADFFSLLKN